MSIIDYYCSECYSLFLAIVTVQDAAVLQKKEKKKGEQCLKKQSVFLYSKWKLHVVALLKSSVVSSSCKQIRLDPCCSPPAWFNY